MNYSNKEWKIDDKGIVGNDGLNGYHIKELLLTVVIGDEEKAYELPIKMAQRPSVSLDLFIEVWVRAIDKFRVRITNELSAEILDPKAYWICDLWVNVGLVCRNYRTTNSLVNQSEVFKAYPID